MAVSLDRLAGSQHPARALGAEICLPCGARLTNRLAKAAMSEQLATLRGRPTRRLVRIYERWGRSGCGLLITGNVMVDARAVSEPRQVVVEDDRDMPLLREWAAAARGGGAQCWMQINHGGRQVPRTLSLRPVAPSAVELRGLGGMFARPRALEATEIRGLIKRYARTAALALEAGFTGVQIHAAHGYLVSQFLSPSANRRDDEWGGSTERRHRFLLDVLEAVRAEIGPQVPLAVKLNSSDFQRGGFDEEESMAVVDGLADAGVDLLEISGGTFEVGAMTGVGVKPSSREREAYFLEYAERVRKRAPMPLMLTGGLRSGTAMEAALRSGAIDICGLARPLALEPELATRLLSDATSVSAVRPRHGRLRGLAAAAETFWYTDQIRRLARGRDPNQRRNVDVATASYLVTSIGDALVRRVLPRRRACPGRRYELLAALRQLTNAVNAAAS
jgi:2,4-dienoyl-CoA reductase-like NADH-dependent reductase (Old Yellow Enzyme family)